MSKKRQQLRLWLLAHSRFELRLRSKISTELKRYARSAANAYEINGDIPSFIEQNHKSKLNDILVAHYSAVIPYFGNMVLSQVKSKKITIEQKRMTLHTSFMLEWLRTEALRKAIMIAETDKSLVAQQISEGISDGIGAEDIARRIRDVSALSAFRAATIARTETGNAATFGSLETAKQAEEDIGVILLKEWLPTQDDRTRDSHKIMAGSDPIPLNEKFLVDGEALDRPSDPSGSPENIINCRCGIIYEEK